MVVMVVVVVDMVVVVVLVVVVVGDGGVGMYINNMTVFESRYVLHWFSFNCI